MLGVIMTRIRLISRLIIMTSMVDTSFGKNLLSLNVF